MLNCEHIHKHFCFLIFPLSISLFCLLTDATVFDAGLSLDKYEIGDLSTKFGSMSGASLYQIQVEN